MAIKTYKPTTPSRRHMTVSAFEGIDKKAKPERSLTENLKKNAGRNSYGRITVRHRGGGNKKKYRIIDFKRDKNGTATVINLQYDPNRSANIALIQYEDGEKRYILAPVNLKAGHKIMTGPDADILPGNCCPSQHPRGRADPLHRALPRQGRPAGARRRRGRSADGQGERHGSGSPALRRGSLCPRGVQGHHRPGGQHRLVQHPDRQGRPQAPHGWRPTVRGSVMNPNDHPHGGRRGQEPGGRPGPCDPWGKPAMGYKTAS